MEACLFCRMAAGDIPVNKVYEDEYALVFHDIHPQAPVHVLVIPKQHLSSLNDQPPGSEAVYGRLMHAAREAAGLLGVRESGYRLVSNCGPHACQSVQHLHFHLLGGTQLSDTMA